MNFTTKAVQLIAEAKIEAAMKAGDFDHLPGFGKPLDDDLFEYDPYWWVRRKIKRENMNRLFDPRPSLGTVPFFAANRIAGQCLDQE